MAEVFVTVASVGVSVCKRDATDRFLQQNCHLKIVSKLKAWSMTQWVNIMKGFFPVIFDRCDCCGHFRSAKWQIGVGRVFETALIVSSNGSKYFPTSQYLHHTNVHQLAYEIVYQKKYTRSLEVFELTALRACLTSSFAPFGRSGRVTHATMQ